LILTRLAGTQDLRSIGSGNIGATNVLRTGRKGLAAATLLLDAFKGTAAVLFALYYDGAYGAAAAGLGAFLGHLFPVWLGFKGGKGVATYRFRCLCRLLARDRVSYALFVSCCACWRSCGTPFGVGSG
jgi:glycerol-3-phosphate acyltransferase PlsY